MKHQFVEVTTKEIFFGNAPKFQTAAPTAIFQPASIPSDSNLIAQQQIGFVLTDFLWKYRWEISIGSFLVAGGIWYGYSLNQSEEKKRKTRNGFSNRS
jgi:hypothetical protein